MNLTDEMTIVVGHEEGPHDYTVLGTNYDRKEMSSLRAKLAKAGSREAVRNILRGLIKEHGGEYVCH